MSRGWLTLLAGVVALLVHLPARDGEFLFYDDGRFVVRNKEIERIGNPARFFTDLDTATSPDARTQDIYRPLRTLSYAVIVQVAGKKASAFHTVAILLHAACAALLVRLLLRAGCGRWAAAAGALCFALHPVTVEVTAWVCSLGDLLCGFFVLLSMLWYAGDRRLLAGAALVLALFGKEHAVVVPGLWLAWDFFLRRERLNPAGVAAGAGAGLFLAIAFLVFRGVVADAKMAQVPDPLGGTHGTAVLTMLAGMGWYAATILFPYGSTFNARVPVQDTLLSLPVWLGLAVLAVLVGGAVRGPRRTRLASAWFLLALVPVSNVIVPLKIPTADRFLYLPLMGLSFAVAELCARAPRIALRAVPAVLVVLALLTVVRIGDWKDDQALIEAGNRVDPKSKTLIWAEAALTAKRAVAEFRDGSPELAVALAENAGDLYRKYLQNARPWERIQVHMELGDLWWETARWSERVDHPRVNVAYSRALESYLAAHKLQVRGVGRVIEEEVRRAAEQIVKLCVLIAQPAYRGADRAIKQGFDTLRFLEERFGHDGRLQFCQLLLVQSIRIRGARPDTAARARQGFQFVWKKLPELEQAGHWTTFLRAQCLLYMSILKDRPVDRGGLERAYQVYLQAAKEKKAYRLRSLLGAGITACLLGEQFQDPAWMERARRHLDDLPRTAEREGLRLTRQIQQEAFTYRTRCQ